MIDKFQKLADLDAGDFIHLNGTLVDHLNGTKNILCEWGATSVLQDAGLFHAAYGTDGFDEDLTSINKRNDIAETIGSAAEEVVYQYCACDRTFFFAQMGYKESPEFKNRFTSERYYLSNEMLKMFCELTAANEIEIAIDNPIFKAEHGSALNKLFLSMAPYLSNSARERTTMEFGAKNA